MTNVRPRLLMFRGRVSASGLVLDAALIGERALRSRAVALWAPGTTLQRLDTLLLLRFAIPRSLRAEMAPGALLVPSEPPGVVLSAPPSKGALASAMPSTSALLSAPLSKKELADLSVSRGSVVLVRGGETRVVEPSEGDTRVDVASWIDVSPFSLVSVQPLGASRVANVVMTGEPARKPREVFASVVPPSPEVDEMMRSIREARERPGASPPDASASWLTSMLASMARAVTAWLDRPRTPRAAPAATDRRVAPDAPAPPRPTLVVIPGGAPRGPSFLDRVGEALRGRLARFLVASNIAEMMSRRQADYMKETMDMFERGDLSSALRRALPLGDDGAGGEIVPTYGLPTPRQDLAIVGNRPRGGATMISAEDMLERLRKLYQQAFERLEREGKIEEAAFVLAELLRKSEEAVAFLERHGRLALAAEVAEARGLAPGLVVRQLFLAGMRERAVKLARFHDAFADAVVRLESSQKNDEARELRVAWASSLASSGELLAAVDVIWSVEQSRPRAVTWLHELVEFGGPVGARSMVRLLAHDPAENTALAPRVDEILAGGASTLPERLALFEALRNAPIPETHAPLRAIARSAARAAIGDLRAGVVDQPTPAHVQALIAASGDGLLRIDVPSLAEAVVAAPAIARPRRLVVEPLDVGLMPVLDAAVLDDGRIVAALGEMGVLFLTRDGRTIARFDHAASSLVVGPGVVIAIVRRGDLWKLTRINLHTRRAEPWIELNLSSWTPSFDGSLWYVGIDDAVVAIDAHSDRAEAAWRLPRCGGVIRAIHERSRLLSFLTHEPADERWTVQLPTHVVTSRVSASLDPSRIPEGARVAWSAVDAEGAAAIVGLNPPAGGIPGELHPEVWTLGPGSRSVPTGGRQIPVSMRVDAGQTVLSYTGAPCRAVLTPAISSKAIALPLVTEAGVRVDHAALNSTSADDLISLGGARHASVRLDARHLCVCDDRGRIVVIELSTGRLVSSIRTGG